MIALEAGSATDVGLVRSNNQDQLLVAHPLYAVADGMGGAAAGEVASAVAIEALHNGFSRAETPSAEALLEAARAANRAVWDQAEANPEMRGMGTTLVALAQVDDARLAVANIGDSRLYAFRDGELRQVTLDHNLVAEMVAEGRFSKEEAEVHPRRNILTRALGVDPEVPIDLFIEEARPGDRFLLCSDGLSGQVSDGVISAVLRRLADPKEVARELVDEAKRRGGNDNITVVVIDVVDDELDGSRWPSPATDDAAPEEPADLVPLVGPQASDSLEEPAGAAPPTGTAAPSPKRRRLRRRRADRQAHPRPAGPVTFRVVGFVLLLFAVLGAGAGGVGWYARSAYFVGLQGQRIVIFQGRPGGVLWLKPTVAEVTPYTTADVLAYRLPTLRSGQEEPSLSSARGYVSSLVTEHDQAQSSLNPPAAVTPSAPPTT